MRRLRLRRKRSKANPSHAHPSQQLALFAATLIHTMETILKCCSRSSWLLCLAAVLAVVLVTRDASAWNQLGHKLVAEIAWRQLEPKQRQSIVDTIRRHPSFDRDFVAKMDDDVAKGDKTLQDHWVFLQAAA